MEGWKKALLVAGAAGAGCVLYYLLREEQDTKQPSGDEIDEKANPEAELAKVQKLLAEMIKSQELMLYHMKNLAPVVRTKKLDFDETYKLLKGVQPEDPLQKNGLTIAEFDSYLDKHINDPKVKEGVQQLVTLQNPHVAPQAVVASSEQIIEVHKYMLEEVEKLVKQFKTKSDRESYDPKTVTLTAQSLVGAKVEEKFGLTSEDIEHAVMRHHEVLATDKEFASTTLQMQKRMSELMGVDKSHG
mmetsp:Transcript_88584/g.141011  ORF Transcript_88584/g.141011 Transcript_88584/m.141011 type:complete len:244 (-) Transcript_88584:111-842(-)